MDAYTDPNRLFSIRVPGGFARDSKAKALVFRHPDIDGAVTVSVLRHSGEGEAKLFDALPSRDNLDNIEHSKRDGMDIAYGDYEGTLLNRAEYWRWWTLQRGPVAMVVSFNGEPGSDSEPVDEFVAGISIHANPPPAVEEFTQIAARVYAEALDKPKPEIVKPLELNTGGNSTLRLDNAYASFLDSWDADHDSDPAKLLEAWFERLWGDQSAALGTFEDTRGLIIAVLKPFGFGRETKVQILRRTIVEGELEMLAAVDTGRTLRFLSHDDLEKWEGVSEDEVFFYARENLAALSNEMELQALADDDGKPKAVIIATGDSHDAARLLLPELYNKLSEVLGPSLLVGVPNRDFMIVMNAEDEELVDNVGAQVKVDAETRPYAISGKLYRLTKHGILSR